MTKTLQAKEPIPPLSFQEFPISVQIRIYPVGKRYGADILAHNQMTRISIDISSNDLEALNEQLHERMENVAKYYGRRKNPPKKDDIDCHIEALAEIGHWAYKKIFGDFNIHKVLEDLTTSNRTISIQIVSEEFFLPWEILYPLEELSYETFWGFNYIISRVIIHDAQKSLFISPEILIESVPKVGLLTDSGLPNVVKIEIPYFEELNGKKEIELTRLRPLDPINKKKELKEFICFWDNELDLAHFACHAQYDSKFPNTSKIRLSDKFPVSLMDLEVSGLSLSGYPLIVLNACQTGNINPLYTSYFAKVFLKSGSRGVVATECDVPDIFAADFTKHLYSRLFNGESLGDSIFATRKYFLEVHTNILGLLYSMYAPPLFVYLKKEINMSGNDKLQVYTGESSVMRSPGIQELRIDELAENVKGFLIKMGTVLEKSPQKIGGFNLSEFEISAEISAEGKLTLLGSGLEVGAKGGLVFKFQRQ